MAIGSYLDIICEAFNSQAIPRLIDLNGEHFKGITDYPQMVHGDVEKVDIQKMAAYIRDMTGIGVLVPDDNLEEYVRELGNLPPKIETDREIDPEREEQQRSPQPPESEQETVRPEDNQEEAAMMEEAKKRLGRGE